MGANTQDNVEPEISEIDSVSLDSVPLFIDYLRGGAKPAAEWMCGLELELFGYTARRGSSSNFARLDAAQVQSVLRALAASADDLMFEDAVLTEVQAVNNTGRVTVEPGGQIEFSGAARHTLSEIARDVELHVRRLCEIAAEQQLLFLGAGFDPLTPIAEQHWFPKERYGVMRPYLATHGGRRAWDMMCRTCAVQTNLDYSSGDDLAKKFVVGNRLAPIITAIFANSPFENGRLSGYKSTRAAVWLETDQSRAGCAPPALSNDFSLAGFVEYTLDVPMIFVRRNGHYISFANMRFRDFLTDGYARTGVQPVFQDWVDHLTTIFTDARLKQYIELRSADSGTPAMALALQALWKGLMYDAATLDEALRLVSSAAQRKNGATDVDSSNSEAALLRAAVAQHGLAARTSDVHVLERAKDVIRLARCGLQRIAADEVVYLDVLYEQVIEDEVCPADILLRNWYGSWHGDINRVLDCLRIK